VPAVIAAAAVYNPSVISVIVLFFTITYYPFATFCVAVFPLTTIPTSFCNAAILLFRISNSVDVVSKGLKALATYCINVTVTSEVPATSLQVKVISPAEVVIVILSPNVSGFEHSI